MSDMIERLFEEAQDNPLSLYWQAAQRLSKLEARIAEMEWRPIETAPSDGQRALVYRPLAEKSGDQPTDIKRMFGGYRNVWPCTIPDGETAKNPTDGLCHATHWMPLPEAPK